MNWNKFLKAINPTHISRQDHKKSIEAVLSPRATVRYVSGTNRYYPSENLANGALKWGHRYVDMDCSYFGTDQAFCSEANHCALIFLLDPETGHHFIAHISAATEISTMEVNLGLFFEKINKDLGRPELYIFRGSDPGVLELELVMALLGKCVKTDEGFTYLAMSTYFIEGENGFSWRAHSSVYSRLDKGRMLLDITFAKLGT